MDITKREITKIAREVNTLVIRSMREGDLGSSELDLIHLVRKRPGISQKEISERLNMEKGAVARRVKNLEEKGYLRREKNPEDARGMKVYALEKAEQTKNTKAHIEAEFYEWLTEELTDEEKADFSSILHRLYVRSKAESIDGFCHVIERLGRGSDEEEQ